METNLKHLPFHYTFTPLVSPQTKHYLNELLSGIEVRLPSEVKRSKTLACLECRRMHKKCNKGLPSCDNCLRRGAICEYDLSCRRRRKSEGKQILGKSNGIRKERRIGYTSLTKDVLREDAMRFFGESMTTRFFMDGAHVEVRRSIPIRTSLSIESLLN
jgi:hypothetical protein